MRQAFWCLLFVVGFAGSADAQVDQALAQLYFKEAQALCERDGGRLWGVSLCGPTVIADAATGHRGSRFRPVALGSGRRNCNAGCQRRRCAVRRRVAPGRRGAA